MPMVGQAKEFSNSFVVLAQAVSFRLLFQIVKLIEKPKSSTQSYRAFDKICVTSMH